MELKDILDYTGLSAENLDEFKEAFDKQFTKKDVNHILKDPELKDAIHGRILGGQFTALKKTLAEFGVDTASPDFVALKDKNLDAIKFAIGDILSKKDSELEDLRSKVGSSNDDLIKQKEAEIEKIKAKLSDTDKAWKQTAAELETTRSEFSQKFKQKEIDLNKGKIFTDLKLKPKIGEMEKIGFEALISQKLKFDIDDEGKFFVTDAAGNRIPNKAKHGTFLEPLEAVQSLADENGLVEKNPHGGQPAPARSGQQTPPPAGNQTPKPITNTVRLHPSAQKAAGDA